MTYDYTKARTVEKPKHKRTKQKRKSRNNFTYEQREEIREHFKHTCQECNRFGSDVHHIKPKGSSNGRAVMTNALLLCHDCHMKAHSSHPELLKKWQDEAERKHGPNYFRDVQDLKERAERHEKANGSRDNQGNT